MNTEILHKINEKLNCLHTVLSTLLPLNNINTHPIKYFEGKFTQILYSIDQIIEESILDQKSILDHCSRILEEITTKCDKLYIPHPCIPNFINYNMYKEYLENELAKIKIHETEINEEISQWINKITELYTEIYNKTYCMENGETSVKYLNKLKCEYDMLKEEKIKKESKRLDMYKDIKKCIRLLCIEDDISMSHKIGEIEYKHNMYIKIINERKELVQNIKKQIDIKEEMLKNTKYLESNKENFIDNRSLSDIYINKLREYLCELENEYTRRINEIYETNRLDLVNLLDLFGMEQEYYEKTDIGISKMTQRINELEIKKDSYVDILNIIERRYSLLESMNEFEKIASDPRRLFKSSFQLNKEEKFRNSAYPTLLKIEEEIFKKISEYTEKYGIFYREGKEYKNVLDKEIQGRLVSKTVFINKYNSPYKKRRDV
ncbi:hypothetical protein P3W45_001201 [Vairimorpha bombi]